MAAWQYADAYETRKPALDCAKKIRAKGFEVKVKTNKFKTHTSYTVYVKAKK